MKIVAIFEGKLYAMKYKGEAKNELKRLLNLWNDASYVYGFLKANSADIPAGKSIADMAAIIDDNANDIDDTLHQIAKSNKQFEEFFRPLNNLETNVRELSLQKGREQYLRLYAIKIDNHCFLITGGAIKLTHLMQERDHTKDELAKLNRCRDHLKGENVFDKCSFYELLNEQK